MNQKRLLTAATAALIGLATIPQDSRAEDAGGPAAAVIPTSLSSGDEQMPSLTGDALRRAVSLKSVSDSTHVLANAEIRNQEDEKIGVVTSVDSNRDGTARIIHADVGGYLDIATHIVSIPAKDLRYLRDRNLLLTRYPKERFKALPAEAPKSS